MQHWYDQYYGRVGQAATESGFFSQIEWLGKLLRDNFFPEKIILYCIAQVMHESNDLSSTLSTQYNNLSGIKYVKQKLANGSYKGFATYASAQMWAKDYYRVLTLPPAYPLRATSANDFYQRLMKNKYFTAGESYAYGLALNAKIRRVSTTIDNAMKLGKEYASGNMNKYTTDTKSLDPGDVKKANVKFDVQHATADAEFKISEWYKKHKVLTWVGVGTFALLILRPRH